ncbi:PLP-dependent aminotransferase family protein [Aquitalea magnusonii]|uniref:Putative 8-amino-7-oxononanoate synthase n=1 Tax=Aquitalea magnusonii TaxID=332411 RepID=A0A318JQV3_9NEIS|nr:PLP-dependent aminotransferase family protein [Aquitalea magnusonii]PXX50628.1 GntR family transcriptional regulator [Aquitalea magnusonii]
MDLVLRIKSWLPDLESCAQPRYQAICDAICAVIDGGQVVIGEKLPPHRTLSSALHVTPGTISRAYARLEEQGRVMSRIGDGTYVLARQVASDGPNDLTQQGDEGLIDLGQNVIVAVGQDLALAQTLLDISQDAEAQRRVLDYQPECGHPRHRAAIAGWLRRFGLAGEADRVAITNGAQHALACLFRILTMPGDTVLCEALSYPGIVALAQQMRLQLIGVEVDEEGLIPESLEQMCRAVNSRVLFCVPTLHNPTTATMSETRRRQIVDIARRQHLQIIEDATPAAILRDPPPALAALLPEQVFFVCSLSKSVSPGLRVGMVQAPHAWSGKLAAIIRANCWMATPLSVEIACRWMENGVLHQLLQAQRLDIAYRRSLAEPLLQGLPMLSHHGSPHLWLTLPAPWRSTEFGTMLRRRKVIIKLGDAFTVGRTAPPHAVRLCLSGSADPLQMEQGLRIIAATLRDGPEGYFASA